MGMTIDEIIQELERTKDYPASDPASDEALDGAIEIIHKYQKITEIVKSKTTRLSYDIGFSQIKKVVEDGKID